MATLLALLLTATVGIEHAAADPTAATDDRSVAVATHEWIDTHVSAAALQADLSKRKARLTRIVMDLGSSPETFTATMTKNSGAYHVSGWWWYTDLTAAQLDGDISANNARLIYVDAYDTPSGERFAAAMVQNTGADQRSWWWYHDTDGSTIQTALNTNNARLAEVKSYLVGGQEFQLALMVLQTGIDAKSWTWGLESDPATIQGYIDSFHFRLISLEHNPFGNFDFVLVASEGEGWSWTTAQSLSKVQSMLHQQVERLIALTPYQSGSKTAYGAVMVDDGNAETSSINAETRRVAGLLAKGLKAGEYGVYLKQVGGAEDLGLDENFRFEPASAIKVLYLLYAMRQVQAGTDHLNSDFVYYPDPSDPSNPGVCPDPSWETSQNAHHITLSQALTGMMQVSDNRYTRGMALRYGISNVDAMAHAIGLTNTHLRQDRIGCLFVNGVRNEMTGVDAGSLYEQVDNHSLLTPANAATFFGFMLGGPVPSSSPLATIVNQEAAAANKSSDAAAFISAMSYHEKAGNEFMCVLASCSGGTAQYLEFTSVAGVITLPFKSGGATVPRDFVYTRFGNDFILPCLPGSGACSADLSAQAAIGTLGAHGAETYRQQIAAALATW
jgi:beta-lactamase class A